MPESTELAKAKLLELKLDDKLETVINPDKAVTVQFNPETLKVSFANQIQTPSGTGDQSGTPTRQFVGEGTTKLALQLWFDVTAQARSDKGELLDDVRRLTQKVAYFITPKEEGKKVLPPPAVRFLWGSFQFDGLMDSLEESLEFFSNDGRPLRASMSLTLSRQKIKAFKIIEQKRPPPPPDSAAPDPGAPAGTKPLMPAPAGSTVQSLADQEGRGAKWQAIAAANNIENPRLLAPGQLIDLDVP
jgi:contractile injection system tube protein